MRRIAIPFVLLTASVPALADPAPVIDNDRVTVWDQTLAQGASGLTTPHDKDSVILFLEGGRIRTASAGGKTATVMRKFGDAVFVPKGSDATDLLVSGGPAHEIVIALKDGSRPVVPNTSGLPAAFPRPGSVKVLDNDQVVAWHYSWAPGKPTPMHFHDKDVVVAYRYDGTLKSVTPDGGVTNNAYKTGDIRFNKANRAHYEELTTGRQSAVMMELK